MAVPPKYRQMGDFHAYYSGARTAPYLTIFVGGNHEASSHLFELYYGGWAAPNIYYLGAANVLRLGPLRIAGLSGIWKGHDYRKPHYERVPYSESDIRSAYHVREWDTRKLLLLRSQVDVGLSHDWPQGVEWCGDWEGLFRVKQWFEKDAREGKLGSVAAKMVLQRLRPKWWFSAHLHVKFAAVVEHGEGQAGSLDRTATDGVESTAVNGGQEDTNGGPAEAGVAANDEEIEIDLDDLDDSKQHEALGSQLPSASAEPNDIVSAVSEELRAQLPEAFRREANSTNHLQAPGSLPFPDAIQNKSTNFLALDKCLPGRRFLQLSELAPISNDGSAQHDRPFKLTYDKEWLAITRVFAKDFVVGDTKARVPYDKGEAHYRAQIDEEEIWVEENLVVPGKLDIPSNFQITAPPFSPQSGMNGQGQQAVEYTNPQTSEFCSMLQIPNPFDLSPEVRAERMRRAPSTNQNGYASQRGRGGGRGGGRGWRGGRGGFGRGRGRGP